ncbi:hypothetical protein IVB30_00230 [Bradyrhizobium sp. 200]|uniref:hypothetical protein n=1 Tax=Bradyrhizobium sp. 200 TaxID=2782665 RepID=UPI001FFF1E2C|nr:hypothetical protein [Bradyrhizobium sp. 200]UPJ49905.1 hypothetical protein IVB30_00230 [Bradyrhizobium sp. 200]
MGTKTKQVAPQVETVNVSIASIRRDPDFVKGFEDYRAGLPPAFDKFAEGFAYERGRQFAAATSPTLRLNSREAANLFRDAMNEDEIV